jgi:hypothetical protein
MSTATIDRLKWAVAKLAVLKENEWVRYEGRQAFAEATAELQDIIATFVDHSAEPAPITLQAVPLEQVAAMLDKITHAVATSAASVAATVTQTGAEVLHAIDASDVETLAAIVDSGKDTVAAVAALVTVEA